MKIKYFVMLGFVILSLGFISANSVTDCRTDFDCFINASLNCSLANVTYTTSVNYTDIDLELVETSTTFMELKGMQESKCIYHQKIKSISIKFSDELVQELLSANLTQEQINQQEQITNNTAQEAVGLEKICKFNTENLTAMLIRWKQGNLSTGDWDVAECVNSPTETSSEISLTPTTTISAYPTEFEVVVNSSKNISKYKWEFGDGKNTTTTTNKVSHTYNSTGQYILKITVTDSNQNEFSQIFNITVGSPKQVINNTIKRKLDNLNHVKTQIKNFDLFYQSSLNSALNINSLNSTLNEIQKNYTTANSENEYSKIMSRLLDLEVPKMITTSKIADSLSFYPSERDIDLNVLTSITGEEYDSEDQDKYINSILAWNQENMGIKISFKEISATYTDKTKPALSVFEIEITKKPDSDNPYFIFYDIEGLKFKDDSLDEKIGYFYTDLPESRTIVFSTTEDISFSDLPIFISPGISKLSISDYNIGEDDGSQGQKWILFILIMSLLIIIGFVTYIILQEWYKRKYENYLFKNRNNLYNLLTYIDNTKKRGLKNKDILVKLKKAGWNSEQIKYVMRKYAGKRTGMFEIPLGKIFGIFKKIDDEKSQREEQI